MPQQRMHKTGGEGPRAANPEEDPIRQEAESQRETSMEPEPDQPQENFKLVCHTEHLLKVNMPSHQPP